MMFKKVGRSVLAAAATVCTAAAAFAQVPASQHVVLIINENSSYNDVVANMPWLISQGDANGYATNYRSDNGGSLLDYLWLASGSCHSQANCTLPAGTHDFHCTGNDCFYPGTATTDPITDNNIFRELNNAGISWKVYAQSYKAAGGTPTTPDNHHGTAYYRRHNGATWYSDIINNTNGSASKIVDLSQLTTDLNNGALPRYMIIVPDGNHDAHDCPVGMSSCTEAQKLGATDTFLSKNLGPILNSSAFQSGNGLAIVTFDECGGGTNAGCGAAVYTALIGPKVIPHTVSSTAYKHENALRTMLDALGIRSYPGASAKASDMSDFFSTSTSKPDVIVSAPANGSTMGSPVPLQASASASAGHSITGWWIYVDKVGVFNGGAVPNISPNIAMKSGSHTVVVRAWDTSGNYGDQTLNLTVNATKPTVAVSTPTNNAALGSPFNLKASATPSSGQKITGWWVYVDNKATYKGGAVDTVSQNLSMPNGTHKIVVRAWETSGNYGDHTLTVTIRTPSVTVKSPIGGTTVGAPIHLQASATPPSGRTIHAWRVYLDGVFVHQGGAVESMQAYISAAPGTHKLVVRAWDSSGAYGDRTITITAK